jgi:hypothetical protein
LRIRRKAREWLMHASHVIGGGHRRWRWDCDQKKSPALKGRAKDRERDSTLRLRQVELALEQVRYLAL